MLSLELRIRIRLLAVVLLLGSAIPGLAQELPELLIAVEGKELEQVLVDNDYFILSRAFFAKRYRIVRVDEKVLRDFESFRINLFPGDVYIVKRTSPDQAFGEVVHWRGLVTDPAFPLSRYLNFGQPEETVRILWEASHSVSITGVAYDVDKSNGRSFAARSPSNMQGCQRPSDATQLLHAAFFSFAGQISAPLQLDDYSLHSLDASPQYQMIIENDVMKSLRYNATSNPESLELRLQFQEYLESIGPNPKLKWMLRHRDQTGC